MGSRILHTGKNQITTTYSLAHKAVDVVKHKSQVETIVAHSDGTVIFCQTGQKTNKNAKGNASYGNCVKIDHGNGYATLYAHLDTVAVSYGQVVKQGQVLGRMGSTGKAYGAHLHFEIRKNNKPIDPTPYLHADLPAPIEAEPHATYKAYTTKWWPEVTDCNQVNAGGYAGVQGKNVTALMARATRGIIQYRVHLLDKNVWLPWVENYEDYAGNKGQKIDAVQMRLIGADGYEVKYRVSPSGNKGWYGWCVGLSDKTGDGYAGVFGQPVDCVQVEIVRKEK